MLLVAFLSTRLVSATTVHFIVINVAHSALRSRLLFLVCVCVFFYWNDVKCIRKPSLSQGGKFILGIEPKINMLSPRISLLIFLFVWKLGVWSVGQERFILRLMWSHMNEWTPMPGTTHSSFHLHLVPISTSQGPYCLNPYQAFYVRLFELLLFIIAGETRPLFPPASPGFADKFAQKDTDNFKSLHCT